MQTHDPWQWIFVIVPVLAAVTVVVVFTSRARRAGRASGGDTLVAGVGRELETPARPAWVVAGWGIAFWSLNVAFIGFVWDVVWHADTGRDKELFTVPHTMIILGLGGIFAAGLISVALATVMRAPVAWRLGRLHVPVSSVPLVLLGSTAIAGFPLDDFWHRTYGVDVTMWSPTHLLMIGGASLAPLALWLMAAESGVLRPGRRGLHILMGTLVLIGLSTFQLEYDLGIAQWQALFQPLLVAGASAFALVAVRVAAGRGAAVSTVGAFLLIRGAVAVFIATGLQHTLPHFPLYLGEALAVEAVFLAERRLPGPTTAALAGLAVGTAGIATEWGWTHLWYQYGWQPDLLRYLWLAALMGAAAAVLGWGTGRVVSGRPSGLSTPLVLAGLAIAAFVLALHLPLRTTDGTIAQLETSAVAGDFTAADALGNQVASRAVTLSLTLSPSDAASSVDRFDIVAWQGHAAVRHQRLVETAPGHYLSDGPVLVGGTWKSLVILGKGDVFEAIPIAMPPDGDSGIPGIAPPVSETISFVPGERLLMRETHSAARWPFVLVITLFALSVVAWVTAFAVAAAGLGGDRRQRGDKQLIGTPVRIRNSRPPVVTARG